jgi:superfamily II DNA or RNA helicase
LDDLLELFQNMGIEPEFSDERQLGQPLGARFLGELTYQQAEAVSAFSDHDTGVLAAATAFGKTVVGAKMISERDTNTLVLVHRKHLLEQWVAQLKSFLDIDPSQIGVIHGAKKRPTGIIDVAVMQSLVQKGVVSDLVGNYGHLIVDECHHISAVSFEAIAREAKARYVLGLSATLTRRDGHQPIIFMQCGPIRYSVSAKKQAALRPFEHKVIC